MTLEISLTAIEADLALVESNPTSLNANLWLQRAHIRAILLAAQPPMRIVMPEDSSTDEELIEALARTRSSNTIIQTPSILTDEPASPEPVDEDIDEDFFAEARKGKRS